MTANQLKDGDLVKYVQMSDGSFRFCNVLLPHCSLVQKGESVKSAGLIHLKRNGAFIYRGRGSHTLNVDPIDDQKEVSEVLGRKATYY